MYSKIIADAVDRIVEFHALAQLIGGLELDVLPKPPALRRGDGRAAALAPTEHRKPSPIAPQPLDHKCRDARNRSRRSRVVFGCAECGGLRPARTKRAFILFSWRRKAAPAPETSSGERKRELSVLVVEDNVLQATNLADLLEAAGYRVLGPVRNVREARRVLEVDRIDAALLDVRLGSEDSLRIASTLASSGIPVLFVSGGAKPDLAPDLANLAYLAKPYTEDALLHAVAALIGERAEETKPAARTIASHD
jgi:CheY-like chemotaxis protein